MVAIMLFFCSTSIAGSKKDNSLVDFEIVAGQQVNSNFINLVYFEKLNRSCLIASGPSGGQKNVMNSMDCWPGPPDAAMLDKGNKSGGSQ